MLRLIVQTKRNYKKKTQTSKNEKDEEGEKENHGSFDEETVEGSRSNTECDQDSDVSFKNDTDEEIDTVETEEEDCTEYMKRITARGAERMNAAKIPCWIETHRRTKWRLPMSLASLPDERWAKKAAEWNPRSVVERPQKRWEDEINDFLKPEEIEATTGDEKKR